MKRIWPRRKSLRSSGERLLDLHDHFGASEDLGRRSRRSRRRRATYSSSGEAGADAGRRLDEDLMAVMDEFGDRGRRQPTRNSLSLISLGTPIEHGWPPEAFSGAARTLSQEIRVRDTPSLPPHPEAPRSGLEGRFGTRQAGAAGRFWSILRDARLRLAPQDEAVVRAAVIDRLWSNTSGTYPCRRKRRLSRQRPSIRRPRRALRAGPRSFTMRRGSPRGKEIRGSAWL